jgi:hypothetical protein
VNRVLQGAKADDLPIELPTTFTLAVNLRTAKSLGLTIPPTQARLDELSEVSDWTLHDLRRTVVSGMARLGVAPHVADKIARSHCEPALACCQTGL